MNHNTEIIQLCSKGLGYKKIASILGGMATVFCTKFIRATALSLG